ncbi:MAG: nuclear transport factor 2 family protein [Gammaproteobacteria bacterium]|nr:nuclear transport factor 2 family protein [Gammaproteobacteria bacterium]
MMYYQALALGLLLVVSANLNAENPYTPQESLHIKEACIELGNRYAYYLDTGQNDKISDLFDEQGSWQSRAGKYSGREDIKLAFSRRPKNRRTIHIVTNHMVDIQSKNMVEMISNYATYRTDQAKGVASLEGQPVRVGRYIDECVRYEKGWIFQSREMEEIFGVTAPAPEPTSQSSQ